MRNKSILLSAFLIGIFWPFWLAGPRVANDYHYFYKDLSASLASSPHSWRNTVTAEGFGEYSLNTLWAWPMDFVYGSLSKFGLEFSILVRILGVIPFLLLGILGIGKLLDYLNISGWGKWVATIFYLSNTYILLLIDGGQLNLALAYAVLPLVFVLYKMSIEEKDRWSNRIKFGLGALALSIFDIRIIYFLLVLILLNFIYDLFINHKLLFLNHVKIGLVSAAILAGFHAYWILPAIFARSPSLPLSYERSSQVDFLSFSTIGHSLFLLQPHWYKNVFGKITSLKPEFVLLPILVFLAPILKKKDRSVGFWLTVGLLGVFLTKGAQDPLAKVYPWLFANIPGFSLFRDPTKFFFLLGISYSVLIGVTIQEIIKRLNNFSRTKFAFLLLVTCYLLLLVRPVWLGKMTGTFSKPIYQEEYFDLAGKIQNDSNFARVFWIPTKAPLGYSSPAHPSVEASRLVQKRPFAASVVGNYEVFNFLRAPHMGQLFDISSIGYIVYPYPDTRREELKPDNRQYYQWFLNKIANFSWATPVNINTPVATIKTKAHQDRFFVAENFWYVLGSDDIYSKLSETPDFNLADNGLVFLEERPELASNLDDLSNTKIILNNKTQIDLSASFIKASDFIFPASFLDFSPDPSTSSGQAGWWKREAVDLINWRDFLQTKYGIDNLDFDFGGGWAIAEGNKQLTINNLQFTKGNILLARIMKTSKGGRVEFFQDGAIVGQINTKVDDKADFSWFEVGKLVVDRKLVIRTQGDINVVNSLVSVPEDEWVSLKEKAQDLVNSGKALYWEELNNRDKAEMFTSEGKTELSYKAIAPTHYKVTLKGLREPRVLAFSETYDSLWEINGRKSLPLYSLINGFVVEKDGEYDVVFTAQKYVHTGLIISAITTVAILSSLALLSLAGKKNLV